MERLGTRPLVLIVGLIGTSLFGASNKLTMVEQHFNTDPKSLDLELGTLIFYFDRKPTIQETRSNNQLIYTFSNTQIGGPEVEVMIARISSARPRNYTVRIEKAKNDTIQVVFTFDPSQVGVSYSHFPSIKMQNGVIFHLYNKELLSKINNASHKEVLTVVSAPRIAIDCGHGGIDKGAIGYAQRAEKDITLSVGLEVADILKKNGIEVLLTRDCDCTLSLSQRTTIANSAHVNAFVSIHANSGSVKNVHGIETFCIDPTIFKSLSSTLSAAQMGVANGFFLSKCNASEVLAQSLHMNLIHHLKDNKFSPVDRHVKHAASQVLLGAHMPAVLVEIGFVTNPAESRLLVHPKYQHLVAQGISNGILQYFREHKV